MFLSVVLWQGLCEQPSSAGHLAGTNTAPRDQKLISYQRKADKMKFMKTQGESVSPTPEPLKAKGTLGSWMLAVDVRKIEPRSSEKNK